MPLPELDPPADAVPEVPARRLRQQFGAVLAELGDDGWTAITSHGEPVGYLISLEAGFDMLAPTLPPLAEARLAAHGEFARGEAVKWSPRASVGRAAATTVDSLSHQRAGRVRRGVAAYAGGAQKDLSGRIDCRPEVAFFDRVDGHVLVYAVISLRQLRRRMVGPRIDDRQQDRYIVSLYRGRPLKRPPPRFW
jgi:hypothetical protein